MPDSGDDEDDDDAGNSSESCDVHRSAEPPVEEEVNVKTKERSRCTVCGYVAEQSHMYFMLLFCSYCMAALRSLRLAVGGSKTDAFKALDDLREHDVEAWVAHIRPVSKRPGLPTSRSSARKNIVDTSTQD